MSFISRGLINRFNFYVFILHVCECVILDEACTFTIDGLNALNIPFMDIKRFTDIQFVR